MAESSTEPGAPARRTWTVAAADAGRRLDLFVSQHAPGLSRTRIQELIREGRVRVGGGAERASHRVAAGEIIEAEIAPRPAPVAEPEEIPLELLHVDDDFVVVNKPSGMVVHAGAGHSRGTLVNALLHRLGQLPTGSGTLRPGIVHRLDRDTSGALVVARNDAAHENLAEQFRSRNVRKIYLALLHGKLARDSGSIVFPIVRDPHRRTRMLARRRPVPPGSPGAGRAARTDWRVIARMEGYTLVEVILHTGRTHQIRAHFAALGHPVVGDTLYGAPREPRAGRRSFPLLPRNFLHAARIAFSHPGTGRWTEVRAPLPRELRGYFSQLAAALGWRAAEIDAALAPYL